MNKMQSDNLINHIKENYKVEGTVFVGHTVRDYNQDSGITEVFECSVFISRHDIERLEANTFYNLSQLVIAKLNAMGLNK